eukprot:snap_masked-scaffold_42-processed-gene-2.25-mRNA-1 protein AED:1.00 eAED:1.00 QI:0/0/0/0/1/1/3/0/708
MKSDQNKSLVFFAVARDSLGATSLRTQENRFIVPPTFQSNLSNRFNQAINEKINFGEADELSLIVFGTGNVETDDVIFLLNRALDLTLLAEEIFRQEGSFNLTAFSLGVQGLQQISYILVLFSAEDLIAEDAFQLNEKLKERFNVLVREYSVQLNQRRIERERDSDVDPLAGADLFSSIFLSLENAITNFVQIDLVLVETSEREISSAVERRVLNRILQTEFDPCLFLSSAKERLIELDVEQTGDLIQDSGEIRRKSDSISVTSIKDRCDTLVSSVKKNSQFKFPELFYAAASDSVSSINQSETYSIISIEWDDLDYISSCKRKKEFTLSTTQIFDNISSTTSSKDYLSEYKYPGPPNSLLRNILSLEFIQLDTKNHIPLNNISSAQSIEIQYSFVDIFSEEEFYSFDICRTEDDVCGIKLNYSSTRVCGAFSEVNKDWIQEGCFVRTQDEDSVSCVCNHTTDYATRVSFRNDVTVFCEVRDINNLSDTSMYFLVVFLPILCLFFMFLFLWGKSGDRSDVERVKPFAVGCLVLHKFIHQKKKKVYFTIIAQKNNIWKFRTEKRLKRKIKRNYSKHVYFYAFLSALKNGHSLIGLNRFDPYFSRAQRIAVFAGVVFATMFASVLLFTLACVESYTSILFVPSVAFLSDFVGSLLKNIPSIFVSSANIIGSSFDTVANSIKILHRVENVDGVQTDSDSTSEHTESLGNIF